VFTGVGADSDVINFDVTGVQGFLDLLGQFALALAFECHPALTESKVRLLTEKPDSPSNMFDHSPFILTININNKITISFYSLTYTLSFKNNPHFLPLWLKIYKIDKIRQHVHKVHFIEVIYMYRWW
jgi:hypothetical protein